MDKMVAVIFEEEKSAYEGALALEDLAAQGSIIINALAVVEKNADGTLSTKRTISSPPFQTIAGTALGALVGVLGGPLGVALGGASGAIIGLLGDLFSFGIDQDFLGDVSEALTPGKLAVIADLDEEWVSPLDTRMEALGGTVYRPVRVSLEDDHWTRTVQAARAELERLEIEQAKAHADRKERLQAQIDRLARRLQKRLDRVRAHTQLVRAELEAKVSALQKQAQRQKGEGRVALENRIAQLRQDYGRRHGA